LTIVLRVLCYLKDCDDCPQKIVEVLATTVLRSDQCRVTELAAEQVHPEDTVHEIHNKPDKNCLHPTIVIRQWKWLKSV